MSRYINYDDLDYRNDMMHGKSSEFLDGVIYMAQRIEEAPSIDIVRCEECKHWHDHITTTWCSRGAELRPQESGWIKRNADDFCSYGERRDHE